MSGEGQEKIPQKENQTGRGVPFVPAGDMYTNDISIGIKC
jgi:hypothetical protein